MKLTKEPSNSLLAHNYISNVDSFNPQDWINDSILNRCSTDYHLSKAVCYIFLSDSALLEINKEVLNHDYYTDIITFDFSDDDDYEYSEIYISIDRVKENAETLKTEFKSELLRVCIHGLLHLGGLNDKTESEIEKMRAEENRYLALQRST